jgi:predicted CoA-binding protein
MTTIRQYSDSYLKDILQSVKRIALLGASDKPDRPSYGVMKYLLDQGYDVIPINPRMKGQIIHGQTVVAGLDEVRQPVDMIDLFMNSAAVESMQDVLLSDPAPVIWMQIGVISPSVAEAAAKAGKKVVMNLCPKLEIPRLGMQNSH